MDLDDLERRFGIGRRRYAEGIARRYVADGSLSLSGSVLRLTRHGVMLSDMIFRDLFAND